jgi:hypothetical protein
MPAGKIHRVRRGRILPRTPRGGLNKTEKKQTTKIAKRVLATRTEKKERNWLYPKTTYSELEHNVPFFLFGGAQTANGLLPLSKGDDSILHPNGAALPGTAPGACREGQQVRLKALTHNCILSGDNANKNTMVRMILFSYASNQPHTVDDILLQPTGTGVGEGWPTIFLHKNQYNNKGIKFLMDRTYQVNGQSSGAVADAGTGEETNWGLAGVKTFSFNYIPKGGKTIKYVETPQGNDSPYPTVDYGMLIIPYGSGVTVQGEGCGRFEMLGSMKFTDL